MTTKTTNKKTFQGVDIKEVWDSRLSKAVPQIDRRTGTWVVNIYKKNNPDYNPKRPKSMAKPLLSYDTKIKATLNDEYDKSKIIPCFEWMLKVRDKYSLSNIKELKPIVARINKDNRKLAQLGKA